MKKENYSEYVKNAYEFYAASGCPDIVSITHMKSQLLTPAKKAEVSDLEAVARTLEYIKMIPDGDIVEQCLKMVYFHKSLRKKGAIIARVKYASENLHISEATVYRNLRLCRSITANLRGLRIE